MKIIIDPHTLERANERGASEYEIKDVIKTGFTIPAKLNRKAKAKNYHFGKNRHGKYFEQKRVEVIYITEDEFVITITVYVFYGKWKDKK